MVCSLHYANETRNHKTTVSRVPIRYPLWENLARFGVLSIACRGGPSASGRHGSNPDVSGDRAPSPPRPMRLTVHIPGVVVPAVDSDNDSDGI